MFHVRPALLLSILLAAGCGTEEATAPDAAIVVCSTTGRYMELRTGASWTYQVDDGALTEKTQTVGAEKDIGGARPALGGSG